MKKNNKLIRGKIRMLVIFIVTLVILLLILLLFTKKDDKIVGTWTTDGVTIYNFNKDNTGSLKVPLSEYKFIYEKTDEKIYIDFENEKSQDSEYKYHFEGDNLVLEGENGTYVFKRK